MEVLSRLTNRRLFCALFGVIVFAAILMINWSKRGVIIEIIGKPITFEYSQEHPYFALPKLENRTDWDSVFEGAVNCSWQSSWSLQLFIAVFSTVTNLPKRAAIRDTWASQYLANGGNSTILIRFFVGQSNNESAMRLVADEAAQYGDLIIVKDTPDAYLQLNKKVLRAFQYVDLCFANDSEFSTGSWLTVAKVDDDNYVNLPKLMDFVANVVPNKSRTIFGSLQVGAAVNRSPNGKWYVSPAEYPKRTYPNYVSGPLYFTQLPVIRILIKQAMAFDRKSPILSWEDIFFTGILPDLAQPPIQRVTVDGVHYSRVEPLDACTYKKHVINSHYMKPEEVRELWRASSSCR